ncbi:MAG: FtsX-like permease family protein [Chitinophagaceae bacterium]|nr:FtsX-like permease family protein [Chitinophagaceae bacterium]
MLKNYFKIAIAVLKRKKFFTFISLFGISFTLTLLIVLASFVDNFLSTGYPNTNWKRELFVDWLRLSSTKNGSAINGGPSFYFFDHYVSKLKTQEKLAIFSGINHTSSYINNKKLVIRLKYTNDQYWDVLQFRFIEGKPYTKQQVDQGEKVAVISEDTRNNYFGMNIDAAGKYIETDNVQYRVSGVVKNAPLFNRSAYADIYVPYSLSKANIHYPDISGGYNGILLLHSEADIPKMKEEFNQMASKVPINNNVFNVLSTSADTNLETYARNVIDDHSGDSGLVKFFLFASIFLILFLLLPTLNLVNINISRIMDRSSEIGVRKAFGASTKTLVYQFVVENLIITFIGGALGILFSFIIIQILNNIHLLANVNLVMGFNVFFFSLLTCILFGLLSGVYPAWRMSRMPVVTALKAQ